MPKKWQLSSFSRFSLRALLLAVTLMAVGLAVDRRYRLQQEVIKKLPAGTQVEYHPAVVSAASNWFRGFYRDVDAVSPPCRVTNDVLLLLQRFPRLERLYLPRSGITDEQLPLIARLPRVRRLALWSNQITDEGIAALVRLTRLEVLDVHDTKLTEKSLEHISHIASLRKLIFDFPVTS